MRQSPVTVEEIEDKDAIRIDAKPKLSKDSTYILEDDSDDEQILFDRIDIKILHKTEKPKMDNDPPKNIPIYNGRKFERTKVPDIKENSVPTLHSNLFKYKGLPGRKRSY